MRHRNGSVNVTDTSRNSLLIKPTYSHDPADSIRTSSGNFIAHYLASRAICDLTCNHIDN